MKYLERVVTGMDTLKQGWTPRDIYTREILFQTRPPTNVAQVRFPDLAS